MVRRAILGVALAALLAAASASPAGAAFGIEEAEVDFLDGLGAPARQAGSHPFAMTTWMKVNASPAPGGKELPDGAVKDLTIKLPPGFAGDPQAVPRCEAADFAAVNIAGYPSCPNATALGIQAVKAEFEPFDVGVETHLHVPFYNLLPPPGVAARFGFVVLNVVPVIVDAKLNPNPPYNVEAQIRNIAQAAQFYSSLTTLWGDPGHPDHDPFRGDCLDINEPAPVDDPPTLEGSDCSLPAGKRKAFFTTPRSCTGPLSTSFFARAWNTGATDSASALTEPGMLGCAKLGAGFEPRISAQPTTDATESPSGLAFDLQIDDEGLTNHKEGATALSDIRKAVVTLPEGVTVNPSQAEGLEVCSEEELARETADSRFGAGCPAASKIGTVEVQTPLLEDETLKGALFVAEPYENRFGTLLAIYQVIKSPARGIVVRLAGKVEPDPRTGQLVTTFDDLPQLPFSDFRLRFREGGRSPLITPPSCGSYETEAVFTPWAGGPDFTATSTFRIEEGVGGGPCPPAGAQPFAPGLSAGTVNNNAGSHSPFVLGLTRRDGDQDLVRFDTTLPPGVLAKIAGVAKCPEAAIAQIKTKTGKQELTSPSCPASSRIGTAIGGAGVGSQLTYVPGSVYLAGPFAGAPLSVLGVVPAVAGPFDVGVVSTRQALTLNPVTGQPIVDGTRSEPIPHILAGIPLKVREIRVDVNRPDFTLNPTSCREMAIAASIWGGGRNPFSLLDDAPVSRAERFQAANCAQLGFKPRLAFRLKGGVRRGANPAFRAVLRPRPGDANLRRTVVRFPRATFLEQAHIRTICTRVQFAQDACPKGAIYGRVVAFTPLLDAPLRGPVYLRSSDNLLPDIVFDLKGEVEIEAAARADSVKGRLRVTFPAIPDAPVSRVVVQMQGGRKGLLVNSRNICRPVPRAAVNLVAHNDKRRKLRAPMRARACKKGKRARVAAAHRAVGR